VKLHGGIVTGLFYDRATTVSTTYFPKIDDPQVAGYDWSNVVNVIHGTEFSCPAYCPTATYGITAYLTQSTTTKDPCFCNGIDLTDTSYHYCYCNDAANVAKFPCTCMDTTTKVFTWVTAQGTARTAELGTAVASADLATQKCNCRRPAAGATGTDETQTTDKHRLCFRI